MTTKLEEILLDKVEKRVIDNKVRSVELGLDVAEQNFKNTKTTQEIKLEEIILSMKDRNDINKVISELSEIQDTIEEAELGIKKVQALRKLILG